MGEDRTPPKHRTTVAEAAEVLGISAEAVRGRIRRGTLPVEREGGTVYVMLEEQLDDRTTADQPRTTGDQPDDRTDLLIAELQDRVRSLEEANRENRRIIAALTSRIPAIEAPSDERESPQTVEEEPESAEPRSATGAAQESERPQQRSGWLAPVDKLPWWHYPLGLIAVAVASGLVSTPWWTDVWFHPRFLRGLEFNELMRAMLGFEFPVWVLPGIFGFWVGLKRQTLSLWRQIVPVGVVVATIMLLVALVVTWLTFGQVVSSSSWGILAGIVILAFVPPLIFYVSGATIGRALQRRTAAKYARLTPDTEAAPPAPRSTTPGDSWSPRKQALLGFAGTVTAALISLFASILTAVMAGGG